MATAHAKSYSVTLPQPASIAGTELKPGQYTVELEGQQVTIKSGKTRISAPVKVETENNKFASTTVRYNNSEGKYKIQEIRLGGTKTRLVVNTGSEAKGGGF